jgi:phage tail sheath protein FI
MSLSQMAAFHRSVRRGFEAMLDSLFMRGAFAGATAETSYRVVTDTSVNTPEAVDQGRFTVELRVAPSLPLRFMTIRLLQTGDRTLVTEET